MLATIDDSLKRLEQIKANDESIKNSIDDLISELNNIKTLLSPTQLNISSNASTLVPSMGAQIKCSFSLAPGAYLSTRVKTLARQPTCFK